MKLKWLVFGVVALVFLLYGCSEMLTEEERQNQPASKGSILVTDRENRLVNQVDTNTGSVSRITSSTGPEPIDIFIF